MNTDYLDRHGFHEFARIIGYYGLVGQPRISRNCTNYWMVTIIWATIYQMTNAFSRATYERETGMLFVHGPSVSW